MESWLAEFDMADVATLDAVGVVTAAVLLVAARVLLPPDRRRKLAVPFFALVLHFLHLLVAALLPEEAEAQWPLAVGALFFLLVSLARSGVLVGFQLLSRRALRPLPKIFGDVVQAAIYVGVVLVTLSAAGVPMSSLLTTSALLTAVVGLSLQETLGNLFAGLALQGQTPFEVGDWIQFDDDPANIGQVVEINWRAIRVLTIEQIEVTVPNNTLARASIRNFTKPATESRRSAFCFAPYSVPPRQVEHLVVRAIRDVPGVLADPPPSVVPHSFDERGVEYHVRFFVRDFLNRDVIEGHVRERIWYALARANIEIPVPQRFVELHEATSAEAEERKRRRLEARAKYLHAVDFLSGLPEEALQTLASMSDTRLYDDDEAIIRQGESDPGEFFIIQRGRVSVSIDQGEDDVPVTTLGPGQFFGEMSLLTGTPRRATVRAIDECQCLVIGKDAFHRIFDEHPDLLAHIGDVLAKRQEQLAAVSDDMSPELSGQAERKGELLERLRDFFSL